MTLFIPVDVSTQPHNVGCQLPTKDNPFMNTPYFDIAADKEPPKSCTSYDNKGVQRKIEKNLIKGYIRIIPIFLEKKGLAETIFSSVPYREGCLPINQLLPTGYTEQLILVKKVMD